MANTSVMFSPTSDVVARNLAQSGSQAGGLQQANLERVPLPQMSSEELLGLLDAAGGRNRAQGAGPRVRGRGKRQEFRIEDLSPQLAQLFQLLRMFNSL